MSSRFSFARCLRSMKRMRVYVLLCIYDSLFVLVFQLTIRNGANPFKLLFFKLLHFSLQFVCRCSTCFHLLLIFCDRNSQFQPEPTCPRPRPPSCLGSQAIFIVKSCNIFLAVARYHFIVFKFMAVSICLKIESYISLECELQLLSVCSSCSTLENYCECFVLFFLFLPFS